MKHAWMLVAGSVLCLSMPALADDDCPAPVRAAVEKTFPGATLKRCKSETHAGKQMYEVKLKDKNGYTSKMDLDPAGLVLLKQEYVVDTSVPTVVMKTFRGKHSDMKVVRTEKWTYPDGRVTYRVTYLKDGGKKAVVYSNNGAVIEEETTIEDEDTDD